MIYGCYDFGYPKLYSHREKTDISFEITNDKIRLFVSMLQLSGCHKLPDRKMYWETCCKDIWLRSSVQTISKNKERKTGCLLYKMGIRKNVVLWMMECLTPTFSFDIHYVYTCIYG